MFNTAVKLTAHKNIKYANEVGLASSITGNLEGKGNYKISGRVKGNIIESNQSQATLVIDESGYVEGDITYANVIVIGQVYGHIKVNKQLEIYPNAIVSGDIDYQQLNIHPDAKVNGRISCLDLDESVTHPVVIIPLQSTKTGT